MPRSISYERELGGLNVKMEAVQSAQIEIRESFRTSNEEAAAQRLIMQSDIAEIKEVMNKVKGGWAALLLIGSVAGAVGAGTLKVLTYFGGAR